jgi:L-iditol 2-dehydrogenase
MQAVLLSAPRQASVVEIEDPVLGSGDALIRVEATGLCGSDISTWQGHHPFRRPPVVLGHEAAGIVAAVGAGVEHTRVGQRVALCPLIPCGSCTPCRRGATNLCSSRRVPGVGWAGTYAEYVAAPASLLYPVGAQVSASQAALVEPAAVALRAVRRAGVTAGSRVAVLGAGGIGSLCARLARLCGATSVLVSDVQPAKLARLAAAVSCTTALAGDEQRAAATRLVGDEGFDTVLVTAAAPGLVSSAIALARPGGNVVVVALHGVDIALDADSAVVREIDIRGSYVYDARDFADTCELVSNGMLPLDDLITHTLPLAEAPATFERIAAGLDYTKIVFLP